MMHMEEGNLENIRDENKRFETKLFTGYNCIFSRVRTSSEKSDFVRRNSIYKSLSEKINSDQAQSILDKLQNLNKTLEQDYLNLNIDIDEALEAISKGKDLNLNLENNDNTYNRRPLFQKINYSKTKEKVLQEEAQRKEKQKKENQDQINNESIDNTENKQDENNQDEINSVRNKEKNTDEKTEEVDTTYIIDTKNLDISPIQCKIDNDIYIYYIPQKDHEVFLDTLGKNSVESLSEEVKDLYNPTSNIPIPVFNKLDTKNEVIQSMLKDTLYAKTTPDKKVECNIPDRYRDNIRIVAQDTSGNELISIDLEKKTITKAEGLTDEQYKELMEKVKINGENLSKTIKNFKVISLKPKTKDRTEDDLPVKDEPVNEKEISKQDIKAKDNIQNILNPKNIKNKKEQGYGISR